MSANNLNLAEIAKNGRMSQADLQGLHTTLCHLAGVFDADEIIADWNRRQPDAPWNCPPDQCNGPYVDSLHETLIAFMKDGVRKARNLKRRKRP